MTFPGGARVVEFREVLARRSRRGLIIGLAIGLGLVVLLVVGAVLLFASTSRHRDHPATDFIPTAVQLMMLVALAGGVGRMQSASFGMRVLQEAAGSRPDAAQVRRIVFRGRAPLNADEQDRAEAYAPLASVYLREQGRTSALFFAAVTINASVQAVTGPADAPVLHALQWVVAVGLVICAVVLFPIQRRRIERAAHFPISSHRAL